MSTEKKLHSFFLSRWEPVLPVNTSLQLQIHYLGNDEKILSLEALKNIYELVATNLKKKGGERLYSKLPVSLPTFNTKDRVVIKKSFCWPF